MTTSMIPAISNDSLFTTASSDLMPIEITISGHHLNIPKFILDQFFQISESNKMQDKYAFELGLPCHKKESDNINDLVTIIGRIMIGYTIGRTPEESVGSFEHVRAQDYVALYKFIDQYFMPTNDLVITYVDNIKKYVGNRINKCMDTIIRAYDLMTKGPRGISVYTLYTDAAKWLLTMTKLDIMYSVDTSTDNSRGIECHNDGYCRQYFDTPTKKFYFCYQSGYPSGLQPSIDHLYNLVRTYADVFNIFKLDWVSDDSMIYLEAIGLDTTLIKKMV